MMFVMDREAESTPPIPAAGSTPTLSTRPCIMAGLVLAVSLVGVTGVWGSVAEIAGAVVAPASTIVDSNPKDVQHQGGGIVADIKVRDGDRVVAGELLVRLDDTVPRANLEIINTQLAEHQARVARITAELDDSGSITFPPQLESRRDQPDVRKLLEVERDLFEARRITRVGEQEQLRLRGLQLKELIDRHEAEHKAVGEELRLMREELVGLEKLYGLGLLRRNRLTTAKRTVAQLQAKSAAAAAAIAQAREKISETKLAIHQLEKEARSEALRDLQEAQAKIAELLERRVTAADALRRVDIRAPRSGYVHDLAVHTVGGVINSGETILSIVPAEDDLVVEAHLAPTDIDQVYIGQRARVRFSGLNQRTTPEYSGEVVRIGADLTVGPRDQSYYLVRISLRDISEDQTGIIRLVPGMPAEVFIATGGRTALSYFLKPLLDQFARTFKES